VRSANLKSRALPFKTQLCLEKSAGGHQDPLGQLCGSLCSKYADSFFLEKVFSASLCVSRRPSCVTVISPQSAPRIHRGPQRRKTLAAALLRCALCVEPEVLRMRNRTFGAFVCQRGRRTKGTVCLVARTIYWWRSTASIRDGIRR
jgi:hypothetical protein